MNISRLIRFSVISAIVCASCSSADEPPVPEVCPDPLTADEVEINASGNYRGWLTPGDDFEFGFSVDLKSSAGARLDSVLAYVDNKKVAAYEYAPGLSVSFPVAEFGHGAHECSLRAVVSAPDRGSVVLPFLEHQSFVIFDEIPVMKVEARATAAIRSSSSAGATYERTVTVESNEDGRLPFEVSDFVWTPASGAAPTLDVSLVFEPFVAKAPDGLEVTVSDPRWCLPGDTAVDGLSVRLQWSNPVVRTDWWGLTPSFSMHYKGTYEGIDLDGEILSGFVFVIR